VRGLGWSIGKSNGEAVIVKTVRVIKLRHLEIVVALSLNVKLPGSSYLHFISVAGGCYLTPRVELLNTVESSVTVQ
jgi:hypothetical protein